MSWNVEFKVIKDLPAEKVRRWEDKVIMSMARETLDTTDSRSYFPRLTGELQKSSMSYGVQKLGDMEYGLGYKEGVAYYTKYVWKMGEGTHWTNTSTLPQWYDNAFRRHKEEIIKIALKNAESELK